MPYYEVFVDVAENNTGRDLSDFLHIGEEEVEKDPRGNLYREILRKERQERNKGTG